jgi:DNA-binding GntR family transcriptional regulator
LWQSFRQGPLITRPLPLSVQQHGAIVEALAAGDAEATERLMRDHILSAVGS